MIHCLKTWPIFFEALADGRKCFEYRKNDRSFQPGDRLELQEYDPEKGYTLQRMEALVVETWSPEEVPGLPAGYCILSLEDILSMDPMLKAPEGSPKLKPCAFCMSDQPPRRYEISADNYDMEFFECVGCHAHVPIQLWNQRPDIDARLVGIANIIEVADNRLMAGDGPVGRLVEELSDAEWRRIYVLATQKELK